MKRVMQRLGFMPIIDHQLELFLREREIAKLRRKLDDERAETETQRILAKTYKLIAGKQWEGEK